MKDKLDQDLVNQYREQATLELLAFDQATMTEREALVGAVAVMRDLGLAEEECFAYAIEIGAMAALTASRNPDGAQFTAMPFASLMGFLVGVKHGKEMTNG